MEAADAVEMGQLEDATVLLIDPPRKGLDTSVMDALLGNVPDEGAGGRGGSAPELQRIIYVSCGYVLLRSMVDAFARTPLSF